VRERSVELTTGVRSVTQSTGVGSAKRSTVWVDERGRPVAGFLNSLHDDFTDCDDYC
jgi:hypothetical protein